MGAEIAFLGLFRRRGWATGRNLPGPAFSKQLTDKTWLNPHELICEKPLPRWHLSYVPVPKSQRWSWFTQPGGQDGEEAGWWHRSVTAAFLGHSITARLRLQVSGPTQLLTGPTSQLSQVAWDHVQVSQGGPRGWRSPTTLGLVLSPRCHLPRQHCLCPKPSQCNPPPKPWTRATRWILGPCVSLWSLFTKLNFPIIHCFSPSHIYKYLFQSQ